MSGSGVRDPGSVMPTPGSVVGRPSSVVGKVVRGPVTSIVTVALATATLLKVMVSNVRWS